MSSTNNSIPVVWVVITDVIAKNKNYYLFAPMVFRAALRLLRYSFFSVALLAVGVPAALGQDTLVINEIMFAPAGGEPEWVELYNTTLSEVHIRDWRIGDERSLVTIGVDSVVAPGGFLVLTKSRTVRDYHAVIPVPVVVISLPALNNSGDAVRLIDPRGTLVDSVWYSPSWGGTGGKSLERVSATGSSLEKQNWGSSIDNEGSTPGRANSISPRLSDIAVVKLERRDSAIRMKVVNEGLSLATGAEASLFQDRDFDGRASPDERVSGPYPIPGLSSGDSTWITFAVDDTVPGAVRYIGTVFLEGDLRRENDTLALTVYNSYPHALVLNEILYAPLSGGCEFVEYINTGSRSIDVSGWFITDRPGADGKRTLLPLPENQTVIRPGGFLVVAADSSIFTTYGDHCVSGSGGAIVILNRSSLNLNNDEDEVVLLDRGMTVHDSVSYSDGWHNPALSSTSGISLERINPSLDGNTPGAWSSCVAPEGATPCRTNSIFMALTNRTGKEAELTIEPNPFSPDGDGYEDITVIRWNLPAAVSQVRMRLYDSRGLLLKTLANNLPSGSSGELIFNGYDKNNRRLDVGMYIVVLEGMDIQSDVVSMAKATLVVARTF